ncbi:MAG: hypothetical protein ACREQY_18110 [Candidatus Binatia bacterium]
MSIGRKLAIPMLAGVCFLGLAACEEQGPAERFGENVDESAERAGERMEEMGEEMDQSAKGQE